MTVERSIEPEAVAAGDAAFVETHYRGVYRFLLWLTNDPDAAADLTQETFAGFWESRSRSRLPASPDQKAWLYGIARNRWRKRLRHHRLHPCEALEAAENLESETASPELASLQSLEADRVIAAMAQLPPDFREALALRVWEELSYAEIGRALLVTENLARWRVHRARRLLAAALAEEDRDA